MSDIPSYIPPVFNGGIKKKKKIIKKLIGYQGICQIWLHAQYSLRTVFASETHYVCQLFHSITKFNFLRWLNIQFVPMVKQI